MSAKLIFQAADTVGESIVWDDRRDRLVWVDIIGRRIQAFTPQTRHHQLWRLSGRPTSIGLHADGSAIVGMERHICRWDWNGEPAPLLEVEPSLPSNRLNEGVVGPDGAFWVGTMQNNIAADDSALDGLAATGRLYRYTADGRLQQVSDDTFGITNTFVFPSGIRLVTADTTKNALYGYEIGADGTLGPQQPFQQGFARGAPDGSCLDAEGGIWTARVAGGACLTRTLPDGSIDRIVELPCSWPTSCCFGGRELSTLYVTSARFTMTAEHLLARPQEGGLFALEPGVKGLPVARFGANVTHPKPPEAPQHRVSA